MTTGSPDQIAMAKIQTPRKADGIAATLESQIIEGSRAPGAVSYTHLTLPTSDLV